MVKSGPGVQPDNFPPEKRLDAVKVFIRFGQLLLCITKDVFHLQVRTCFSHVDRKGSAVLASGQTEDVSDRLTRIKFDFAHLFFPKAPTSNATMHRPRREYC